MLIRAIWVAALLSLAFLSGCIHGGKPKIPVVISAEGVGSYSKDAFIRDYGAYKVLMCTDDAQLTPIRGISGVALPACTQNLVAARTLRDVIINRVRSNIDKNYRDFESELFYKRASSNILSDFTELGLALATNVSNGERVKNILAITLATFKGTRISIDKNLFAERTTEIIISKMQASRDRLRNTIVDKMTKLPVENYPAEEAFDDLVNYFYAGTLQAGLQTLANDAGQDAAAARGETQKLERSRVPTPEQTKKAFDIRAAFEKLRTEAKDASNAARQKAAIDKLTSILDKLDALDELGANPTVDMKIDALKELLKRARQDPALLDQLNELLAQEQPAPPPATK